MGTVQAFLLLPVPTVAPPTDTRLLGWRSWADQHASRWSRRPSQRRGRHWPLTCHGLHLQQVAEAAPLRPPPLHLQPVLRQHCQRQVAARWGDTTRWSGLTTGEHPAAGGPAPPTGETLGNLKPHLGLKGDRALRGSQVPGPPGRSSEETAPPREACLALLGVSPALPTKAQAASRISRNSPGAWSSLISQHSPHSPVGVPWPSWEEEGQWRTEEWDTAWPSGEASGAGVAIFGKVGQRWASSGCPTESWGTGGGQGWGAPRADTMIMVQREKQLDWASGCARLLLGAPG